MLLTAPTSIGYSLGDTHINGVILRWLHADAGRKMKIVNPRLAELPTDFEPVHNQVSICLISANEFFKLC
jgi:hypothetical protein